MTSHAGAYWLSGWRLIFGALSNSRLFMASPMTSPYFYLDHISNSCYFFPVFLASIFLYCLFIHILCFLQFLLSHKYVKPQKLLTTTLQSLSFLNGDLYFTHYEPTILVSAPLIILFLYIFTFYCVPIILLSAHTPLPGLQFIISSVLTSMCQSS